MENNTASPHNGSGTEYDDRAPYEGMSVGRYVATRIPSLKPPMLNVPNPWKLVRMLNAQQWAFFMVGFIAWVSEASDKKDGQLY